MQALWTDENNTLYSSVFIVPPGKVCILHAVGFEEERFRVDATETKGPQLACIHRILVAQDAPLPYTGDDESFRPCGWIYDWSGIGAIDGQQTLLSEDMIITCDGTWQVGACRNIGIIGIPGSYRLELNDATAVGVAQVYAELYDVSSIPAQHAHLFFN